MPDAVTEGDLSTPIFVELIKAQPEDGYVRKHWGIWGKIHQDQTLAPIEPHAIHDPDRPRPTLIIPGLVGRTATGQIKVGPHAVE